MKIMIRKKRRRKIKSNIMTWRSDPVLTPHRAPRLLPNHTLTLNLTLPVAIIYRASLVFCVVRVSVILHLGTPILLPPMIC
jgi:hypothetical protein